MLVTHRSQRVKSSSDKTIVCAFHFFLCCGSARDASPFSGPCSICDGLLLSALNLKATVIQTRYA